MHQFTSTKPHRLPPRKISFRLGHCRILQLGKRPTLETHGSEYAVLFVNQVERRVELGDLYACSAPKTRSMIVPYTHLALLQHDQPIIIDHRPQPMRHYIKTSSSTPTHRTLVSNDRRTRQQKRAPKLLSNRRLYLGVRLEINTTRRFIEYDDRAPSQQRASHRDQLSLTL